MRISHFSIYVIIGGLIAGLILQSMMSLFIKKWHKYIHFKNLPFKLEPLIAPLRVLIPALTLSLTLPLLDLPLSIQHRLEHFLQLWIIASVGWLLIKMVRTVRDTILYKYNTESPDFNTRGIFTQIRIIEHLVNFFISILSIFFMIMTFSQAKEIGVSLFASAGIVSIIVGLAAQKTLGNVICGIQIALSQPIRLEDSVIVEGEWGWIEEITLTYVVMRIWDLRRLIIPISYFVDKPFQNWTRVSADILGSVFLYVDYTVPIESIRQELTRILQESPRWDKKVNVLQVTDIKEGTVELRALMSSTNASISWDLRCEVREKLLTFLQNKHAVSFPRTRIEVGGHQTPDHPIEIDGTFAQRAKS